jgi:multicomponent Na+:H+ antiporter subunit F
MIMVGIFESVALVLLGLCIPLCYRVFKGPTVADRVLATDAMGVLIANALALLSVQFERQIYLDVAIVVAALGFAGTVAISKVLEGGKL